MNSDRLTQIEKNLTILHKQKAALEEEALLYSGLPKIRADQQIQQEVNPKIQTYEQERQQILADAAEQLQISEPEAEIIVGEIVTGVTQLDAQPLSPELAELRSLLQTLLDRLNEPSETASLSVKGMISTFPPFVGVFIEPEIDIKAFCQQHLPTFTGLMTRLIQGAAKK